MSAYAYEWSGPWGRKHRRHQVVAMTGGRHGHRHGGPGADFGYGGYGGYGPPWGGRRGRRAARGDVRAAVLLLLAEEARNGYQLMQEIEQRSEGLWKPSPGSTYPALSQLEDEGLVEARQVGSGREFALTDAGRKYVEEHREELGEPWTAVRGGFPKEGFQLRQLVMQIGAAAMQVMGAGTKTQREQAIELLSETRRGLYRILSEDEPSEDTPDAG